jgi:MFS transporter, FHS family, L-fucose permease
MMIMGGGIVSWLQGYVADLTSIHWSYLVGVACFIYLAFYAWKVQKIFSQQGLTLEENISTISH